MSWDAKTHSEKKQPTQIGQGRLLLTALPHCRQHERAGARKTTACPSCKLLCDFRVLYYISFLYSRTVTIDVLAATVDTQGIEL